MSRTPTREYSLLDWRGNTVEVTHNRREALAGLREMDPGAWAEMVDLARDGPFGTSVAFAWRTVRGVTFTEPSEVRA